MIGSIDPETTNNVLNTASLIALALIGGGGRKVANKAIERIVRRLDGIEDRLDKHDRKINRITKAVESSD